MREKISNLLKYNSFQIKSISNYDKNPLIEQQKT